MGTTTLLLLLLLLLLRLLLLLLLLLLYAPRAILKKNYRRRRWKKYRVCCNDTVCVFAGCTIEQHTRTPGRTLVCALGRRLARAHIYPILSTTKSFRGEMMCYIPSFL